MEALWNLANDYHLTNGDFHKLRRLSFLSQTIIKRTFPCPFSHEMFCPLKFSFVRNRKQLFSSDPVIEREGAFITSKSLTVQFKLEITRRHPILGARSQHLGGGR